MLLVLPAIQFEASIDVEDILASNGVIISGEILSSYIIYLASKCRDKCVWQSAMVHTFIQDYKVGCNIIHIFIREVYGKL